MCIRDRLGGLGHDGAVDIEHLKARRPHAAQGFGQQHGGVGPFEAGIGIGKVAADVAQTGCAQQGITQGMEQYVPIGVGY